MSIYDVVLYTTMVVEKKQVNLDCAYPKGPGILSYIFAAFTLAENNALGIRKKENNKFHV